jgi:hypothetical protein
VDRRHPRPTARCYGCSDGRLGNRRLPDGLLSHTCLASTDGTTLRHHSQWISEAALREFWRTDAPQRIASIDEAVPGIERHDLGTCTLYRSHHAAAHDDDGHLPLPGCIVIVDIDFDTVDYLRQQAWIDTVMAALEAESPPGLIAAHFHTNTDGTRVINYAEWTSEKAHQDALATGPPGVNQTDRPEWRRVQEFPGVRDLSRFTRYTDYRTRTAPAAV